MKQKRNKPQPIEAMIEEAAKLKNEIGALEKRYSEIASGIKDLMQVMDSRSHQTMSGCIARIKISTKITWDLQLLRKTLSPENFTRLCPPSPDSSAIRKEIERNPALLKCKASEKEIVALEIVPLNIAQKTQ